MGVALFLFNLGTEWGLSGQLHSHQLPPTSSTGGGGECQLLNE